MTCRRAFWVSLIVLGLSCVGPASRQPFSILRPVLASPKDRQLRFCLVEGVSHNCVLRDARVAAHVIATSGPRPRLVVAFPADNAGIAFWARAVQDRQATLTLQEPLESIERSGLRGVRFRLRSSSPLQIDKIVLGSIRVLRDFQRVQTLDEIERLFVRAGHHLEALPAADRAGWSGELLKRRFATSLRVTRGPTALVAERTTLDGKHRFVLRIAFAGGQIEQRGELLDLKGPSPLVLDVEASSTLIPYAPLESADLLSPAARHHLDALAHHPAHALRSQSLAAAWRSLDFLSTREKFLAGSWRFLTYFGRDTLISLWLLQPVLAPEATERGLHSVLARLAPDGDVAHEESLGDQAVRERVTRFVWLMESGQRDAAVAELRQLAEPTYDYKMVDDDFILAPVVAAYLARPDIPATRAQRFLSAPTLLARASNPAGDESHLTALARNLALVLDRAIPYARTRRFSDLVGLTRGLNVGDWRDSEEGLGFGRFAVSINAALVPAALRAMVDILNSPKIRGPLALQLTKLISKRVRSPLAKQNLETAVAKLIAPWEQARRHFAVQLTPMQLRERLTNFLKHAPLSSLERELLRATDLGDGVTLAHVVEHGQLPAAVRNGLTFDALSLDATGSPIGVMNTDDGFSLFAFDLPAEALSASLVKYEVRYPLGLLDSFGVYVANPALSTRRSDYALFDRMHYHGTVVWSWPMLLLECGLMRQLEFQRQQNTAASRALVVRLHAVLARIAAAEERVGRIRASELWTVRATSGGFVPLPFGAAAGHVDESNALQLWSNLNLVVDFERTRLGLLPSP